MSGLPGPRPDTDPSVHERVLRWFVSGAGARIVDVGAGEGALSQALAQRGYHVVACDRDVGRFRLRDIPYVATDLDGRLPFAAASFDAAVAIEVVEHLENPYHLARELFRVVRPGGTVVMSTPNTISVYSRLHFLLLGTCDFFDTLSGSRETACHGTRGHINPVGFPELRHAVERVGLRIVEVATNRDVRLAMRGRSWRMRVIRWLLSPLGVAIRAATLATRGADPIARQMLDGPLLFGECLIVRAERRHATSDG